MEEEDTFILSNFSSICRFCLGKNGVMSVIFANETDVDSEIPLMTKISDFIELQIHPGDGLPPHICHRCLFKTEWLAQFRSQCVMNDAKLRRITRQLSAESPNEDSNAFSNDEYEEGAENEDDKDKPLHYNRMDNSVVMVVDPSMDCDTSDQSEAENQQDIDNAADGEPVNDTYYKNVFMCKYCDQAFTSNQDCCDHEAAEHNPSAPYACSLCDMLFSERTHFISHMKSVHSNDKPYQCMRCEKAFGRRSDLRKHSIVHTGVRPFQCHFCMKSFSRNTNLSKHLRIHSGQKPHVCPQCPRSFVSKGDLSRHIRVHSGAKPFKCDKCPLSFRRRDKLLNHQLKHRHDERLHRDERLHHDIEDDAKDSDLDEQIGQEDVVVNVDPYKSMHEDVLHQEAMKIIADNYELPRVPDHISGEGCFSFNADNKRDATRPNVKKILMNDSVHKRGGIFNCKVCSRSFARKRELLRHSLIHSGNKPFGCTQCDKKFSRKDKLVGHERTHEKIIMSLPCVECGATFTKKDALVAHLKSHFPENVDDDDRYDNGNSVSEDDDLVT